MKHTISKVRLLETFAIVTFPIALAVGCTTTDKTASLQLQEQESVEQQADISAEELNSVTYFQTQATDDTTINEQPQHEDMQTQEPGNLGEENPMDTAENEESVMDESPSETINVNLQIPAINSTPKPETAIFHFGFNQSDVAEQDYDLLKQHAQYLLENPAIKVNVNGYSDNQGSAKNNYEISKKRAQRIADILMTLGVSETQIKVNSYGESFPLNNENNWDENRRVELQYSEETPSEDMMVSIH